MVTCIINETKKKKKREKALIHGDPGHRTYKDYRRVLRPPGQLYYMYILKFGLYAQIEKQYQGLQPINSAGIEARRCTALPHFSDITADTGRDKDSNHTECGERRELR